jgi:hypothetical protein
MALTRATLHLMLLDPASDRMSSGTAATRPGPVNNPVAWLATDEDDDDDIDDDEDDLDDEDDDDEVTEDGDEEEVADDDEDDFDDDDEDDDEESDDDVNAGAGRQNPDRVH